MQKTPTKVLQIIADFKKGGVQSEVMYPARILPKEEVNFDVLLLSDTIGYYEEEFKKFGNIYRIPLKRKKTKLQRFFSLFTNYFYVKKEINKLFSIHKDYDAVHVRHLLFNAPCVSAAKKAKIPVRIAHCAVNRPKGKFKDRFYVTFYLWCCAQVIKKKATSIFGVTKSAVEYIAGEGNGIVMKNPTINLDQFNPEIYANKNTDGIIRLIMVGSYSTRKNQKFAIDILKELCKEKPNSELTFIGYPRNATETYLDEMKQKIKDYGLEDNVKFLPQDTNIPLAMSESTFLLMPSLQEGLPNVALEAQAMGLPCYVSSDVSTECDLGLCEFLDLKKGADYWSNKLVKYVENNGFEKHYIDMSEWNNEKISKDYLEYWRGKKF